MKTKQAITERSALLIAARAIAILEKLDGKQLTESDRIDLYAAKGLLESVITGNEYVISDNRGSGTTIQKLNPNQHGEA